MKRYVSSDEDSDRWSGFAFREGDIVISTRSKSGTTWVQMICALLIFQSENLPAPLGQISPWLDHTTSPIETVLSNLQAQQHRRIIKTHTPLDGVPIDPSVSYVVVGRHPLDMAVSLYHQGSNIDRRRLSELTCLPMSDAPTKPRRDLHSWLLRWIDDDTPAAEQLDGLPGVVWHSVDAWSRRGESNVTLLHYKDLSDDLAGQMRELADRLHVDVAPEIWPGLIRAASFDRMRGNADIVAPNSSGVLVDNQAFFRRGRSGDGATTLTDTEHEHYERRVREMAADDVIRWLHQGQR